MTAKRQQWWIGDQPIEQPTDGEHPCLTDREICERVHAVEVQLRQVIRDARERPFVIVGRCADELAKLRRELRFEETR